MSFLTNFNQVHVCIEMMYSFIAVYTFEYMFNISLVEENRMFRS